MNRFTILILFTLFSCLRNPANLPEANSKLDGKVLQYRDIDTTMAQDSNEIISDFYTKFARDSGFQLSRIKFPLTIETNTGIKSIQKRNWRHDHLFLSLNYTTHITDNNNEGVDYGADYGNKAIFSWIYPSNNKKKDYYFTRENSNWYLSKIIMNNSYASDSTHFIKFLQNFMNDSIFQFSRTRFPLKINSWTGSEEESRDTTYYKSKSQWRFMSFYNGLDSLTDFSNNWNSNVENRNRINIFVGGVENGIMVEYYFERIKEQWTLIEMTDQSN